MLITNHFFLCRDLKMRKIQIKILLLGVSLGLLVFYLSNKFTPKTLNYIPKNVREGSSGIRRSKTNNSYVYSFPKCQQNASAGDVEGFSSLPGHIKDFLYHQHCLHFPMILDVHDKCGGADESAEVFLLMVIKSSPVNYERREALRKTWAQERLQNGVQIRRVFLSGVTGSGFERERQNRLLELEHDEYNDILQWDFRDTFFNLTLKQVLFLEWMERNCPKARFLLNGDDDVFVNTDNMVEYLQGLRGNNGSKHLFTGHLMLNKGPIRSPESKYYVPVQVQKSESYPPFCAGGGFLLSGYTAMVIYNMSKSIPFLPCDDVYMGMCLAKAGLRPVFHMGVKIPSMPIPSHKLDEFDPCYYKEILLVHKFSPAENYLMWKRINDPNLKCH